MKNLFKAFLVAGALIIAGGCASPNMKLSDPATAEVVPGADKALVYFLRPKEMAFKIHAAVYDGDELVGFVPYNQKLPYLAEPGEHMFMVISEAADFMKADLLPGQTYYAQVVPRMGAWRARFSLWPVTKEQLATESVRKWIDAARPIQNKQNAYEWAENNRNSVMKKKDAYFPKWQTKPADKQPYLAPEDGE